MDVFEAVLGAVSELATEGRKAKMLQHQEQALAAMGFTRKGTAYQLTWTDGGAAHFTAIHRITIAEYEKDWGFIWQRGATYTIAEERAPTFDKIIELFWKHIFRVTESNMDLLRFQAQHRVRGHKIYGAVIRQLARENWDSNVGYAGTDYTGALALAHAATLGDEQGHAIKVAIQELGSDPAAAIYDDEWNKLVAQNCHPKE